MALKGAIIGFGHIAANGHVPAYKACKDVEICAVCDSCLDRKALNQRLLSGSRFYTSAEELLEKEAIDFVDVSTPPAMHAKFIKEALSRNKHVLCEKPLVLSSSELVEIQGLVKDSGCCVVTVHNWRYSPIMQEISKIVESGILGKIRKVKYDVLRVQPSVAVGDSDNGNNWRLDPSVAGGGILVDHGWHAFYLVNDWIGHKPYAVECRLENRKFTNMPVEDTAEVTFFYPSGVQADLFFTWAGRERNNTIVVKGEQGELSCLDDRIIVEAGPDSYNVRFDQGLSKGSHHPEWYSGVLREFINEINDPAHFGKNFKEAASCLTMLEGCKRAHETQKRAVLDSDGNGSPV